MPGRTCRTASLARAWVVLAVTTAWAGANYATADEPGALVIGVLEQPQCKEDPAVAVRALFLKQGHEWVALSTQETAQTAPLANVTWTIGFNGRTLGTVASVDPGIQSPDWAFPRDHLLLIAPGQSVPIVGNKDARFAGWCGAPDRRPLVVVTSIATSDPDRWRPFTPSNKVRERLFREFQANAGPASVCPAGSDGVPWVYGPRDLVYSRGFEDRAGRQLIAVGLDPRRNTCDFPDESAWSTQVFLLSASRHFLGSELSLVDAGDYDADGESELLFWYSGYNQDGYTLLFDGLRKQVSYRWKYH